MVKMHTHSEHDDQIIEDGNLLSTKRMCLKNKRGEDSTCFEIYDDNGHKRLRLSYYIGLDCINEATAIYVQPKVNTDNTNADYLAMLCSCLRHPDVVGETENLYQINFEQPHIEIEQNKDLLTPLLIVHFLQVTRIIVK